MIHRMSVYPVDFVEALPAGAQSTCRGWTWRYVKLRTILLAIAAPSSHPIVVVIKSCSAPTRAPPVGVTWHGVKVT